VLSTTPPPYDQYFLEILPLIERVIAFVCRRHGCSADEAEELDAIVKLKLIEDDYARLRSWKGNSTISTFLTTVVRRLFQDYLIARRGKWRPSEEAKRLGPIAEKLEALLYRPPTLTFDQACEVLLTNHKLDTSRKALAEIARRLPPKTVRRFEGEEQLAYLPSSEAAPDEQLRTKEGCAQLPRIRKALGRAMGELPPEDRLLIRMHFLDGFTIAVIARRLCLDQKPLYGRIKKALHQVQQSLEREEIRWEEVAEALRSAGKGGPESV
jgi:RNA polymerase sigma factor (sigma-70 family)